MCMSQASTQWMSNTTPAVSLCVILFSRRKVTAPYRYMMRQLNRSSSRRWFLKIQLSPILEITRKVYVKSFIPSALRTQIRHFASTRSPKAKMRLSLVYCHRCLTDLLMEPKTWQNMLPTTRAIRFGSNSTEQLNPMWKIRGHYVRLGRAQRSRSSAWLPLSSGRRLNTCVPLLTVW